MESFRALKAILGVAALRHDALTGDEVFKLRGRLERQPTSVFALKQGELDQLNAKAGGAIQNRGEKNGQKQLSYYFKRRTGLVRIRAGYRDPGQAERGIRALLASEDIRPQGAAFFIGLDDDLFEQLWLRAATDCQSVASLAKLDAFAARDELRELLDQNPRLQVPGKLLEKFVGNSAAAAAVRKRILLASRVTFPVLIEGETGTGKEVVAQTIHEFSDHASENFIACNCGGIPTELLESQLFGHKKGAFTGAFRDKKGFWKLADQGTLFLDEIGDLSLPQQVKILRALEKGEFWPLGSQVMETSNARIIAATNRNLMQLVQTGLFREDLYYRLFNFRIRTPALREHRSDIPAIALHFWSKLVQNDGPVLPPKILQELTAYNWPGNARELRAFLANLATLADGGAITLSMYHAVMRDRLGPIYA